MTVKRREFITLLGGAAAWPLAAHAQQGNRVRRIGVLWPGDENDPGAKTFGSAFTQALAALGWTDGRNVRMDLRWGAGDTNQIRALARELVGLQPDIIAAAGLVAVRMMSGCRLTNSCASARIRSMSPPCCRSSIRMLRPSVQPKPASA